MTINKTMLRPVLFLTVMAMFCGCGESTSQKRSDKEDLNNYRNITTNDFKDKFKKVEATLETPDSHTKGGVDDVAIWVHPTDPAFSTVLGTDKKSGISVFDMNGKELFWYQEFGKINNVDVRYGFELGGEKIDIAVGSNWSMNGISIWKIDPITKGLINIAARPMPTENLMLVYGVCAYHSKTTGKWYVFLNHKDEKIGQTDVTKGKVEQWEIFDNGKGQVDAKVVRIIDLGSQTEGMVCDDEAGFLYISEESVGIWKYLADPDGPEKRGVVDLRSDYLHRCIEGLAIYQTSATEGYLIAASQANDAFIIYDRITNDYIGKFKITDGAQVDGVDGQDGIEVMNMTLNSRFRKGVFISHDYKNMSPEGERPQNFKYVPWESIANAFDPPLKIETEYNIREN